MGEELLGQPDGAADNEGSSVPKIVPPASSGERGSEAAPTFNSAELGKLIDQKLESFAASFEQRIEPKVTTEVQRQNDRRWSVMGNLSAKDLKSIAELVKKHNGDVDAASDELALKAMLDERRAGERSAAPASQPATESTKVSDKTEEALVAAAKKALAPFKLPEETEALIKKEWGNKTYSSTDEAIIGLNEIIANPPKPPSGAGIISPTGAVSGETSLTGNVEKAEAVATLYGKLDEYFKAPSKYAAEIAAAKTRLRELGETV